jgi:hypothetical protein
MVDQTEDDNNITTIKHVERIKQMIKQETDDEKHKFKKICSSKRFFFGNLTSSVKKIEFCLDGNVYV